MQKKRVLVSGCNGEMGKLVCSTVNANEDMYVAYGFDKVSNFEGNFPIYSDLNGLFLENHENLPNIIIDFSSPEATRAISEYACNYNVPIVVATTGLTSSDMTLLTDCAKSIPVFQSANMSFDVALLKSILEIIAVQLSDTDIEISEIHHSRKKDAPSGTAKMLANAINKALGNTKTLIYGRDGKRKKNEIGLSSIRGGNIAGEHTVQFFGENERLEIKHISYSREVFAEGAVKAAQFLLTKENGFYTMDDLIASL